MPRQPTLVIYGIKSCDTMKKARDWLDAAGKSYAFHDYKAEGVPRAKLEAWTDEVGWEALLNRSGTTFRALADSEKQHLDRRRALSLMLAQPSMIKRPVLEGAGALLVGFKPDIWAAALATRR
ncbi:MAG: arsenate reductase [Hyphomonadaceae bacterium]|nr:arsenate reductase [Hyphomonadaceae bacterium]